MRQIYLLVIMMLCICSPVMADKRGEQILDDMSSAIDAFGRYEVGFVIENGGEVVAEGEYIVDGERYKLTLANQEIYGDGELRYTIDNHLKEVVMEAMDQQIPMIVANPARAFKGLKKSFDSKVVECDNLENICVELTPRKEGEIIDSALIEINSTSKLPTSAQYSSGNEVLTIIIRSIITTQSQLLALDELVIPSGYEVIDIR